MSDGLEEQPDGSDWMKTRAFGHVAYARRQTSAYDEAGRTVLWVAVRTGNVPIGVPFHSQGVWAMLDVIEG